MRILARTLAFGGALLLGAGDVYGSHEGGLVRRVPSLGSAQYTDPSDPAYWGLKKGDYIPRPNCWGGNWPGSRHKFDYEICSTITYLQQTKEKE